MHDEESLLRARNAFSDVRPTFDAEVRDVVGEAAIQIPLHLQLKLTAVLQQGLHLPPAARRISMAKLMDKISIKTTNPKCRLY
jgi:hypothetical protein